MEAAAPPTFPPPPPCAPGTSVTGTVSHLAADTFWLQRDEAMVEEMGERLEDEVEVLTTGATEMRVGSAVVAEWREGSYRGLVREVLEEQGLLVVNFVDWGNTDVVRLGEARVATAGEVEVPQLALRWV